MCSNPLGDEQRALARRFRQQHAEFIPAEARKGIGFALVIGQKFGQASEVAVTGAMAEGVVDVLELVDVDDQQADRALVAYGVLDPFFEFGAKPAAVHETGERIQVGELDELGTGVLLFARELGEALRHAVKCLRHLRQFVVTLGRNLVPELAGGERRRALLEIVDRTREIVAVKQRQQRAHREQDDADYQALAQDRAPAAPIPAAEKPTSTCPWEAPSTRTGVRVSKISSSTSAYPGPPERARKRLGPAALGQRCGRGGR